MRQIRKYLDEIIKKEKKIVIFTIIIFIIGLISGSLFINFINQTDRKVLLEDVTNYFKDIKVLSNNIFGMKASLSILLNNFIQLLIIFLLGISIVGILVVIFILFFKGFTTGLTIGAILFKYSYKGIIASILYVFPVLAINISIYLFISFFAIYGSLKFIKAFIKKDNLNFKTFLGRYSLAFIISIILMVICSFLEGYLSPILLKLFTFLI